jgi:biotin-(acetyl-CoA carboxylase) ligase
MKKLLIISALILMTGCSTFVPVKRNFPEVPKELQELCPELKQTDPTTKLSEVLKVVTENYSEYHTCKSKNDAWNDWYKSQKQIFESVK